MQHDFDVIVIGSGAGGAAFAHTCAAYGKRVLVIERGRRPVLDATAHDERAALIEKQPYDDRTITLNEIPTRLYMGGVVGGGTAVFGAVMLRPSVDDFHPGKYYGARLPRPLWDWPIAYEQLQPYFDEAESLFGLAASPDAGCAPLEQPGPLVRGAMMPLAPINERLIAANRKQGLRPFRLPLAIDAEKCRNCSTCAGFLCPYDARRSASHLVEAAASGASLQLLADTEVERFEFGTRGAVAGVVVRKRSGGPSNFFRAKCFALAAGAVGSPAILLRSGIDGPHIGRNFMMHYSPVAAGVFVGATGADETFVKQVGFADFYFGTDDLPEKMGVVQSLPAPGPLMMAKSGLQRWPRRLLQFLRHRMLPLMGIIEDLPDPMNRVVLTSDGSIALEHRFSDYDRARGRSLGRQMQRILRRAGAVIQTVVPCPAPEHVGHQCGTLRFGGDPQHAVVDADCRMFGRPNLFVVDGSVLPTSMGVGPSLTIVANGLRVARTAVAAM